MLFPSPVSIFYFLSRGKANVETMVFWQSWFVVFCPILVAYFLAMVVLRAARKSCLENVRYHRRKTTQETGRDPSRQDKAI